MDDQSNSTSHQKGKFLLHLWKDRAQRFDELNERAMTRARNMFKDGETYADRRGRIFLDVDDGISPLYATPEEPDADDN